MLDHIAAYEEKHSTAAGSEETVKAIEEAKGRHASHMFHHKQQFTEASK